MSCRNKIFVRKQLGPQALLWKSLSVVNTLHKYSLNCPRMSFVQNSLHSASQPWQMWDQHVETSHSPGLHQTFICNSLHNGIVVKPKIVTAFSYGRIRPVHGAVLNKTLCLCYTSHLGNPSWHSWHTNRLPWHRDAACLCRVLSPPLEICSLHNLTNRM